MELKKKLVLSVSTASLAVAGFLGINAAVADPPDPAPSAQTSAPSTYPTKFARNGLTYGPADQAKSIEEIPDMIAAMASNGKIGWVKKADYVPDLSGLTPEKVKSYPVTTHPDGKKGFAVPRPPIPVYAEDGKTVIGHM